MRECITRVIEADTLEQFKKTLMESEKYTEENILYISNIIRMEATFCRELYGAKKKILTHAGKVGKVKPAWFENLNEMMRVTELHIKNIKDVHNKLIKQSNKKYKLSIVDENIGVHSTKFLLRVMEKERRVSEQLGTQIYLTSIWIKNYSAHAGMLSMLANSLKKIVRDTDVLAHYKNGIFLVLMPNTNDDSAEIATQRLQASLGEIVFIVENKEIYVDIKAKSMMLEKHISSKDAIQKVAEEVMESN